VEVIFTHDNADFDAVASLLAAHKLYPQSLPVLPQKMNRNVAEFITLYQNALPFIHWHDLGLRKVERVILVDTQRIPEHRCIQPDTPVLIIDHHPPQGNFPAHVTFAGESVGAATTLLVEQMRAQRITITTLEATLMALGVYVDTGAMTYGRTTPRDVQAAAWLLEQKAALDTVRRYLSPPLDDTQQALFNKLVSASDTLTIGGHTITICATEMDVYVQVNSVAHSLRDMFDPDALVVLVQMPKTLQMVCRATSEAVDVGNLARHFGGGGHTRAAAANVHGLTMEEALGKLRRYLEDTVRPMTCVADLMSYGVQTIQEGEIIIETIQQLRRIGHEGYPVLDEEDHVVGLLTLRDADRALEHGLKTAQVRDVMAAGTTTLNPTDSVSVLEKLMVDSGWGQIPVVDDHNKLIGIVTRTDLINHWVRMHPTVPVLDHRIEDGQIIDVLGESVSGLIAAIAQVARQESVSMYMVGGVVRDLLLARANFDLDFVVEADAIQFAGKVRRALGGTVKSYRPFGTAKWRLDEAVAQSLKLDFAALPEHIDFASSRNEFYNHPTALPSVYNSSIKLDLHRRDFTMNTLAVQLSPEQAANRLLDFYGGVNDLNHGRIRVLHSLSFVDDPTRVLRAVRFEQRLGFKIGQRTAELIATSYPMLSRITGERLRNELKLLLGEQNPERALLVMQERGILPAIHPDLAFCESAARGFRQARETQTRWPIPNRRLRHLYWHIIIAYIPADRLEELCKRLLFGRGWTESLMSTARIFQQAILTDPVSPASGITRELDQVHKSTIVTLWIIGDELQRQRIEQYLSVWRNIQPKTNGYTLQALGLPPGPNYRVILSRLRDARLDGDVTDDVEEGRLLQALIAELDGGSGIEL
jgi:tRNA nucleotidyltransferase (CCA-adding enzyme)